jgi:hypothetical protein
MPTTPPRCKNGFPIPVRTRRLETPLSLFAVEGSFCAAHANGFIRQPNDGVDHGGNDATQ